MSTLPELVSTEWLAERLHTPGLKVVDATWYMPNSASNAQSLFVERHLPGAVFFDIDAIADLTTPLPHMLPPADQFQRQMGALGIGGNDSVVVYDAHGLMSAARAWWMFRAFGHASVAVLDGGLPAWQREGRPLEAGAARPVESVYRTRPQRRLVSTREDVQAALAMGSAQVVDARAASRFDGQAAEPRAGLRSGHIPGSHNLPFSRLLDPSSGLVLPPAALRQAFEEAGVNPNATTICSCGSGITACVLALALHRIGNTCVSVYDGAWAEWGSLPDLPVATRTAGRSSHISALPQG